MILAAAAASLAGCSVKDVAITELGSALSSSMGTAFAAESDLELAGQAVPFSLKLTEALLVEQPENDELLTAAASGYTQYAYVWIQQPADFIEANDFLEAQRLRDRARDLYLRAHEYALRAMEVRHPGFRQLIGLTPVEAATMAGAKDVELLYWSAASLGGAISLSKTDPELVARQSQIEALIDRAFSLDPDWDGGTLHEFLIGYEMARPGGARNAIERAREHFGRALELSNGKSASVYVGFAEAVSVSEQDKTGFTELLEKALAIDPRETPTRRLANVANQARARWLMERLDELFLE